LHCKQAKGGQKWKKNGKVKEKMAYRRLWCDKYVEILLALDGKGRVTNGVKVLNKLKFYCAQKPARGGCLSLDTRPCSPVRMRPTIDWILSRQQFYPDAIGQNLRNFLVFVSSRT
jgi:hypothetical protein